MFRREINNDGILEIIWEHRGEGRKENEGERGYGDVIENIDEI
jgi:hypothetical protein